SQETAAQLLSPPKPGDGGSTLNSFLTLLLEKLPFFALAAGSCIITFVAQHRSSAVAGLAVVPLGMRFENAFVAPAAYLHSMLWPLSLGVYYPLWDASPAWQVVGGALTVLGFTLLALATLRSRPYVAVGWFWFLGMLVPVVGVVQVGLQARADR